VAAARYNGKCLESKKRVPSLDASLAMVPLLARAVFDFADTSGAAFAVVAVGFVIAAAHRLEDLGAEPGPPFAGSGLVSRSAERSWNVVAKQPGLALEARKPAAYAANA
jgi:hypothetical protein